METVNRHMDYIGYYERQMEKETAKRNPRIEVIQSCKDYIAHSRARILVLNEA
jgi:hypothetical protein